MDGSKRRIHLTVTNSARQDVCKIAIDTDDSDQDIEKKVAILVAEEKITVDQQEGLVSGLCRIRDKYKPRDKKGDSEPGCVVASIFPQTKK